MKKNILTAILALVALLCGCSSGSDGNDGTRQSGNTSGLQSQGSRQGQGFDMEIDEKSLIVDTIHPAVDIDSLAVPERRFYSRHEALEFIEQSEFADKYNSGILPRMLSENFPYADRLLNNAFPYFIVADKQSMRLALFDRYGVMIKSYPMACASGYGTKHRRSDSRTPEGFFIVQGVYDSSEWPGTGLGVPADSAVQSGAFGPRFIRIRTDAYSSIGIQGGADKAIEGHRATRGSLQISDEAVEELAGYAVAGMPVIINPGDRDAAVNRAEGYDIPQISIGLAVASTGRNFASNLRDGYPAKPATVDTATMEPSLLPDSVVIELADSIRHPELHLQEFPDSIHH